MDPYTEAEVSGLGVESRIHWILILQAVGIFLLVAFSMYVLPLHPESWQDTWLNGFLVVAIGLSPWALGAAYLALRVSNRWAIDGLVFSAATGFVAMLLALISEKKVPHVDIVSLINLSLPFVFSVIMTMLAMTITKGVLLLIRVLVRKIRTNHNANAAT